MASDDAPHLQPGDTIGEYRIVAVIGNGGFSVVYLAEDTTLLRPVAIKQLNPQAFVKEGTREWFIREARLAASLNHPNIVQTYALREQDDTLFLIMEYVGGGDLRGLIDGRGPLDRATFLRVATSVCRALETLHARNVLHRDIKPENILISEDGRFKLADFGLAHIAYSPADADDATGPQPGTLLYMSPEQALGQEVTTRSDLYSLAVVLYEAMTGHYYLDLDLDRDDDELLGLIVRAEPLPPEPRHPTVAQAAYAPIRMALAKDPAARPASARAFLAAIRGSLAPDPSTGRLHPHRAPSSATREVPLLAQQLAAIRALRDREGRATEAQARLEPLLRRYADLPEVMAECGETLLALGQPDEGLRWLEEAVRQDPNLPFAHLALAHAYRDTIGDPDAAQEALVAAIMLDPDLVYAATYPGGAAFGAEDPAYSTVLNAFQAASEAAPSAPVLHNLAQLLALVPDYAPAALAAFEDAVRLDPDYGPAYVGLGNLLLDLGEVAEAVTVLEQALDRGYPHPRFEPWPVGASIYRREHAYLVLAIAYAQQGHVENSAAATTAVLDLAPAELDAYAPDLLDLYVSVARAWLGAGELLRAYKFLNQAIPIAAFFGAVDLFTLLDLAGSALAPAQRRARQWPDAEEWLLAAAAYLASAPNPGSGWVSFH